MNYISQYQSLPLELKIVKSQIRIREWLNAHDDTYVSVGGLDSAVLLHLVRQVNPRIPAVFCNTGLEYPEVVYWARTIPDCAIVSPKIKFGKVVEKYGYPVISKEQATYLERKRFDKISKKWRFLLDAPFKISAQCCNAMKKKPFKGYKNPFLGVRIEESRLRRLAFLRNGGCNVFRKRNPYSAPLSFWLKEDILRYAKENGLSIPSIYGKIKSSPKYHLTGLPRTGCVFCLFGIQFDFIPNRIQKLYETHPGLWRYGVKKLKLGEVMDFLGFPYKPFHIEYAEKRAIYEKMRRDS